ncbi:hypothetical protein BDR06DRAFT_1015676 [Suillus hirtellus]|nr:hypothetical protein BDR06DRAFT_1015676 [Suillus hirtellus]
MPIRHLIQHAGNCINCHGPFCPQIVETVPHFLLDCRQYARERHILSNALRRQVSSLAYLLTSENAISPLMRHINSTGRFKTTFGEIPIDKRRKAEST